MVLSSSAGSWAGQDLAQRLVAAPTAFVGRVSYAENYGGLSYLKLTVTESISLNQHQVFIRIYCPDQKILHCIPFISHVPRKPLSFKNA